MPAHPLTHSHYIWPVISARQIIFVDSFLWILHIHNLTMLPHAQLYFMESTGRSAEDDESDPAIHTGAGNQLLDLCGSPWSLL